MSNVTRATSSQVIAPISDTAAAPTVQFGGSLDNPTGTGIYGGIANVKAAVLGSDIAVVSATGVAVTGTITASTANASLAMTNDLLIIQNAGVPDATVGAGSAGKGSMCIDRTNANL